MRRRLTMGNLIGYLGPPGTFTEEAARRYGNSRTFLLRPYPTIDGVFAAVAKKEIDQGVVPVENSLEGSVNLTLDLLSGNTDVKIKGELLCRIKHFLLARPGQNPVKIKEVYSHPQALAQCRFYLDKLFPEASRISMSSTAEAAALVAQSEGKAVIASRRAARLYGLKILQANIQDEPFNITRFFLLALEDAPRTGDDKTSLLIGLHDKPGSLFSALGIFAGYNLNLTKIESRPVRGELGKYIFFLDIEGHREDKKVAHALKEMEEKALFLKVLGSYPHADTRI
ncbi:MAG: prephenate dehydratase [Dethiobacter sp.]|jgi:prephenate dehydratase|nr:MAG: prephenate dehydratase [Dethiobacter sp.]